MSKRLATRYHKYSARQYDGMAEPIVELRAEQTFASHDGGLLERARTQWQFGDWQSLVQINRDTLEHHPDRAKLALLAAAGRLQTGGNDSEARQLIRLAQSWGVSRKLINQILIAGVHNSLGRAATISNQRQRASQHFKNAITVGMPGSDTKLLTQARSNEQLSQLGLPAPENCARTEMGEATAAVPESPSFNKNLETIINALGQQKVEFDAQFKKQADELIRVQKFFDISLKKEIANSARQIGDFITLQNYFNTEKFTGINLETNGWPVSSDFALYLIELIEHNNYDLVIEFGSGISTVIIAKALAKAAQRTKKKQLAEFVSFDHLEHYYQRTCTQLKYAGLISTVQLYLAPLQDWRSQDGSIQPYYACQSVLADLAKKYAIDSRLLVIVDGPPGATCKHARYPASPLVLQHFSDTHIDILLDDYVRADEKEIVQRWKVDFDTARLQYTVIERKLEKDACLIQIRSLSSKEQIPLESEC